MNQNQSWKPGDWAVYVKQKRSVAPGPRAKDVMPAAAGESYSYLVEKYWVVKEILDDGRIKLVTRRGKTHIIPADDPRLRKPTWWQRLTLASRYRAIASNSESNQAADE